MQIIYSDEHKSRKSYVKKKGHHDPKDIFFINEVSNHSYDGWTTLGIEIRLPMNTTTRKEKEIRPSG